MIFEILPAGISTGVGGTQAVEGRREAPNRYRATARNRALVPDYWQQFGG